MTLRDLSASDRAVIGEALRFIFGCDDLDGEFETRLGVSRQCLRDLIARWPNVDDAVDDGEAALAINNTLNEVCNGLFIPDAGWIAAFTVPRDEVAKVYHRWTTSRGWAPGLR